MISPIHKKGSTTDTSNYRKVTVMPSIDNFFYSILKNRLIFKNEVLLDDGKFQAGFKTNSRTSDNLFMLHTLAKEQMKRRNPLYVAFVDLTKAFDYIH